MTRTPSCVVDLVVLCFALGPFTADARDPPAARDELPPNIQVSETLEPVVHQLLLKSETFRQQCARIAAAMDVRVTVHLAGLSREWSTRARATISQDPQGLLRAVIEIPVASDYAELLAHEFEHVIEQLEGIDLLAMARSGGSDVVEIASGTFETARAKAAGLAAAGEFSGDTDPALAATLRSLSRVWRAICARSVRDGPGPGSRGMRIRSGTHKEF